MIDRILENLEKYYPSVARDMVGYREHGTYSVIVISDDGRETLYNDIHKTIRRLPVDKNNMTEEECRREFGYRLRDIMLDKGVSQMELSDRTGIPCPILSGYMNGKNSPSQYKVDKIARALNCSADDFRYL